MDDLGCVLCGSKNEKGEQRLHRLPCADPVRERWISFIRTHLGSNWTPGKTAVSVCSNHFEPNDFTIGFSKHLLKSDSRPSINPKIQINSKNNKKKRKIVEQVRIASGTVHPLNFSQDVDLVHIFVEKSTEVVMDTLYSAKDVDNFIKSDKNKILPKIIHNYETNICRLKMQPQPLSDTENRQMANMKKELGVLRQKLFQWALVAIEEDLTISSTVEQQVEDFDKAEFLIYKSTEKLKRNKDVEIKNLKFKLKLMADAVQKMEQERDKVVAETTASNNVNEAEKDDRSAEVSSLQLQLQQVQRKEKQMSANLANRKAYMTHSATVIQELRRKNRQFLEHQTACRKMSSDKDGKIKELHKNLQDSDVKIKQLRKELEEISENLQGNEEEISVTEQLEEQPRSLRSKGVMTRKRKNSTNSSSEEEDCAAVSEIEEEAPDQNTVHKIFSTRNQIDEVQFIQVD